MMICQDGWRSECMKGNEVKRTITISCKKSRYSKGFGKFYRSDSHFFVNLLYQEHMIGLLLLLCTNTNANFPQGHNDKVA